MQNNLYKEKFKSYLIGFALSVFFSVLAFMVVMQNLVSGDNQAKVLIILAIVQAVIQLIFFLHLKPWTSKDAGAEEKEDSHFNLAILASTTAIILILVIGSVWIMNNLNYNMTPMQMDHELMKMENIKK
jgi:cytochrome o ubiquinol oxidase operon protein cyoD